MMVLVLGTICWGAKYGQETSLVDDSTVVFPMAMKPCLSVLVSLVGISSHLLVCLILSHFLLLRYYSNGIEFEHFSFGLGWKAEETLLPADIGLEDEIVPVAYHRRLVGWSHQKIIIHLFRKAVSFVLVLWFGVWVWVLQLLFFDVTFEIVAVAAFKFLDLFPTYLHF